MITPAQITAVLDRYAVRHHWRASRAASTAATGRLSRYAVFTEGRQVSEPATHAQACAEARRLELFSRTHREGWDSWGNQTGKFEEESAHG